MDSNSGAIVIPSGSAERAREAGGEAQAQTRLGATVAHARGFRARQSDSARDVGPGQIILEAGLEDRPFGVGE